MNSAKLSKTEIKLINQRIRNLCHYIEIEGDWLACWNMCRDLAHARTRLG